MHLKGLDHIGIVVRNINESILFYRNIMGFVPGEIEDIREKHMKIVKLRKGDLVIELLEPDNKEAPPSTFGLKHIAFHCDDIDEFVKDAVKNKLRLLTAAPMEHDNDRFVFFSATDGEFIEVMERKE
ncbi:MAG: VOC family protein [Candidatus Eremiobacteraeota bacterium]|nr:VOC family protein [Candidatus Eremiobacteraeota bacterium]